MSFLSHALISAVLLTTACAYAMPAQAVPVSDALDRPALQVRAPERAVLLSAAQAGSRIVAVGERGLIAISDDGGHSWRQAPSPTSSTLTAVHFAQDDLHGFAVGHGGTVLATDDRGEHWSRRLDGRLIGQIAVQTARASADPKAMRDADRLLADGADKPLLDLLVLDDQRVVVVGAYGIALSTVDAGRTWSSFAGRLDNPKGLHLYAVRQRRSTMLIAGEQGLVLLSDDVGKTFHRVETPYKGSYFTAELPADRSIVLAGLRGNVLRSNDNGVTWSVVPAPMPVSITASRVAGDRLLMTNQAGFVLALDGDHLAPINRSPLPPLNSLLVRPGGAVLALSVQGVMLISDK